MTVNTKNIAAAIAFFLLSTLLTGVFIVNKYWLYSSANAMILSGSIAGIKWVLQILAAMLFLKGKKRWEFIKHIGMACFIGSCILFSYNVMPYLSVPLSGLSQLLLAIALSLVIMAFFYCRAVKRTGLSIAWSWGWAVSVAVAVVLQATIVF